MTDCDYVLGGTFSIRTWLALAVGPWYHTTRRDRLHQHLEATSSLSPPHYRPANNNVDGRVKDAESMQARAATDAWVVASAFKPRGLAGGASMVSSCARDADIATDAPGRTKPRRDCPRPPHGAPSEAPRASLHPMWMMPRSLQARTANARVVVLVHMPRGLAESASMVNNYVAGADHSTDAPDPCSPRPDGPLESGGSAMTLPRRDHRRSRRARSHTLPPPADLQTSSAPLAGRS